MAQGFPLLSMLYGNPLLRELEVLYSIQLTYGAILGNCAQNCAQCAFFSLTKPNKIQLKRWKKYPAISGICLILLRFSKTLVLDSDSVNPGSNPGPPATENEGFNSDRVKPFFSKCLLRKIPSSPTGPLKSLPTPYPPPCSRS